MTNAMNTNQVKSLKSLTRDFLQRAQSYLEQAEACNMAVGDFRESTTRFKNKLDQLESEHASYSTLASDMLERVEHILHVLEVDGRPDPRLADLSAAVRNSAKLLQAVCASRASHQPNRSFARQRPSGTNQSLGNAMSQGDVDLP